jgi:hypothetical protein
MGTFRLRHGELFDAFGRILLEESESLSLLKNKCSRSFIRTCSSVNYSPLKLPAFIENHLHLDTNSTEETNQLNKRKNRIDLV